jgi:hypothetical protein
MELEMEEKIFYGNREIFFKSVTGKVRIYHQEEWTQCHDHQFQSQEEIQKQFQPRMIDGIELPVVIPGIPALNFIPVQDQEKQQQQQEEDPLPDIFTTPLIKCPSSDPSIVISGVASGVRSGLIKIGGHWYRLKGCGNHDQGFLLRKRIHPKSATGYQSADWCDIRGCAFLGTTLRELYYTKTLAKLLPSSVISANSSLGFMEYSDPEYLPCGPAVQTTCILERTIGDRRFGTHVLAGIELLLPFLIPEDKVSIDSLLNLFPMDRPERETNDLSRIIQTGPFISDFTLGTSQCGHDREIKGLCWPHHSRDHTTLANLVSSSCSIPLSLPSPHSGNRSYPPQWRNDSGPEEMSDDWRAIWDVIIDKLTKILGRIEEKNDDHPAGTTSLSDPSSCSAGQQVFLTQVLSYLYSRCGYDCGLILSSMHSQRISWGTYQDSMCRRDFDEWHCNAHVNNLVVIPPEISQSSSSHAILSFLDVDMAYGEDEMIQLPGLLPPPLPGGGEDGNGTTHQEDPLVEGEVPREGQGEGYGQVGVGVFDHILWREYVNMMEVLAGNDSSTGVPNAALRITESYSPVLKGIQSALYDTMVLAYQDGYRSQLRPSGGGGGEGAVMEYDEDLHQAAYCLIQLAIIVMVDYLA